MKFWKTVGTTVVSLISLGVIILFEINQWPAGSSIAGVVLGLSLPALGHCIQDISDTTNWKTSQRKLERGDFINDADGPHRIEDTAMAEARQLFGGLL